MIICTNLVFSSAARESGNPDQVKPFPDFATVSGKPTLGYSGRIADLFVNYNVIRDAVSNGSNITEILKDILKKVSDASGGIWDFDLVGPNTSSPNDVEIAIVDRRFPVWQLHTIYKKMTKHLDLKVIQKIA